ncbi:FIG00451082: hypothetical protein [Ochrobactrum soli]|uniref:Uncharacterized protein n=1 Tax=Ochrobactrum soli TaxID=2448455 RepID=A0A2P9HNL4_9HYPH|nr:FIG00451082: hypothetical protein [[Ochrobactrum] soli]
MRVCLQCRNLIALYRRNARLADKLVYGWHTTFLYKKSRIHAHMGRFTAMLMHEFGTSHDNR